MIVDVALGESHIVTIRPPAFKGERLSAWQWVIIDWAYLLHLCPSVPGYTQRFNTDTVMCEPDMIMIRSINSSFYSMIHVFKHWKLLFDIVQFTSTFVSLIQWCVCKCVKSLFPVFVNVKLVHLLDSIKLTLATTVSLSREDGSISRFNWFQRPPNIMILQYTVITCKPVHSTWCCERAKQGCV